LLTPHKAEPSYLPTLPKPLLVIIGINETTVLNHKVLGSFFTWQEITGTGGSLAGKKVPAMVHA
jgi:hypothetical protein